MQFRQEENAKKFKSLSKSCADKENEISVIKPKCLALYWKVRNFASGRA